MPAGNYNFTIEQGSSFKLALIYKNSNNVAIDLTGWQASLIWLTNLNTNYIYSTNNPDNSLYSFVLNQTTGSISLKIPAKQTKLFEFTTASYYLELVSPSELYLGGGKEIIRLIYGTVTVLPSL